MYKMSKDEVVRAMGAPLKESRLTVEGKKYEVWEYLKKESGTVKIKSLGTFYAEIFFLDGKVAQWDEDGVYAQQGYDFKETIFYGKKIVGDKIPGPDAALK